MIMGYGNAVKFTGNVIQIPGANIKEFLITILSELERSFHLRGQVKVKAKVEKDGVLHNNPALTSTLASAFPLQPLNPNLLRGDEPRSTLPILPHGFSFFKEGLQAFDGILGLHQFLQVDLFDPPQASLNIVT